VSDDRYRYKGRVDVTAVNLSDVVRQNVERDGGIFVCVSLIISRSCERADPRKIDRAGVGCAAARDAARRDCDISAIQRDSAAEGIGDSAAGSGEMAPQAPIAAVARKHICRSGLEHTCDILPGRADEYRVTVDSHGIAELIALRRVAKCQSGLLAPC